MGRRTRTFAVAVPLVAALLGGAVALRIDADPAAARVQGPSHWVATWAASPQPATPGTRSAAGFRDQTIREIVFTSSGGSAVRVTFTNAFGSRPLAIGAATVAIRGTGARLAQGTVRRLTFGGRSGTVVPPGGQVISDPVRLAVRPLTHLAVSVFLPRATGPATEHVVAQQINYVAAGNRVWDHGSLPFGARTGSWYYLAAMDLLSPARDRGAVAALGDSITDGLGSPVGANARWPNDLARRFAALSGETMSVVDEGIAGNRVLHEAPCCGLDAIARFERDVRQRTGVRDVVLLEGVNDIGYSLKHGPLTAPHTDVSALQIIEGYEWIISKAHAAGLRIFGATLTPFAGARYWTAAGEAKREAVNAWIRTSGAFDGVIDFASVLADPGDPERLNPGFDSGDHLHPNARGYRAMADAVDLGMLLAPSSS
jgi:lysophospholipase L1-like esterase